MPRPGLLRVMCPVYPAVALRKAASSRGHDPLPQAPHQCDESLSPPDSAWSTPCASWGGHSSHKRRSARSRGLVSRTPICAIPRAVHQFPAPLLAPPAQGSTQSSSSSIPWDMPCPSPMDAQPELLAAIAALLAPRCVLRSVPALLDGCRGA
jgi:hypothetical protein